MACWYWMEMMWMVEAILTAVAINKTLYEVSRLRSPMFFGVSDSLKPTLMDSITFREGFVIRDQQALYFLTFTVCGWIDLFTRKVYKDILLDSFIYCRKQKGLELYAYVIMSNHMHLIARAKEGFTLSDIIRDFKKYTHNRMIKIIDSEVESRRLWMKHQFAYYASRHGRNENYQIWTNDNHPEALYTADMTMTKLHYIHHNPVRAGWVAVPQYYLYSSASNYAEEKGLIEIDLL